MSFYVLMILSALSFVSTNFGMQQAQIKTVPAVTSSLQTSKYLTTIANWASSHPLAVAATALGVSGTFGYLLYQPLKNYFQNVEVYHPQNIPAYPAQVPPASASWQLKQKQAQDRSYKPITQQLPVAHLLQTVPAPAHTVKIHNPTSSKTTFERHETESFEKIQAAENPLLRELQTRYPSNPSADQVITWYDEGRTIFRNIMYGLKKPLTAEEVKALTWFIYIYISARDHSFFDEGTMKIYGTNDEINRLYEALKQIGTARASSHYPEWFMGYYNPFTHYGIDIEGLPPRDMGTIAFAKHPHASEIYIKPEPHGLTSVSGAVGHTFGYTASTLSKTLPKNIVTALNLPQDVGENLAKERIPKEFNQFIKLVDQAQEVLRRSEKETEALKQDIKTEGVKAIYPKIQDYLEEPAIRNNTELYRKIKAFYDQHMKQFDQDWQRRRGHEKIVTFEELLKAGPITERASGIVSTPLKPNPIAVYYNR